MTGAYNRPFLWSGDVRWWCGFPRRVVSLNDNKSQFAAAFRYQEAEEQYSILVGHSQVCAWGTFNQITPEMIVEGEDVGS